MEARGEREIPNAHSRFVIAQRLQGQHAKLDAREQPARRDAAQVARQQVAQDLTGVLEVTCLAGPDRFEDGTVVTIGDGVLHLEDARRPGLESRADAGLDADEGL